MGKDIGRLTDMVDSAKKSLSGKRHEASNVYPGNQLSDIEKAMLGDSLGTFKSLLKPRPATEEQRMMAQHRECEQKNATPVEYEAKSKKVFGRDSAMRVTDKEGREVRLFSSEDSVTQNFRGSFLKAAAADRQNHRIHFDDDGRMNVGTTFFVCHEPDVCGNVFPRVVAEEVVSDLKKRIKRGFVPGWLGPKSGSLGAASHFLTSINLLPDGRCVGTFRVLLTKQGRALKHFIQSKAPLGLSPVGKGRIKSIGDDRRVLIRGFEVTAFNIALEGEPFMPESEMIDEAEEAEGSASYSCDECKAGIVKLFSTEEECDCGALNDNEKPEGPFLGKMYKETRVALQRDIPFLEWKRESKEVSAPIVGTFFAEGMVAFNMEVTLHKGAAPEHDNFEVIFSANAGIWPHYSVTRLGKGWSVEKVSEVADDLRKFCFESLKDRRRKMNRITDTLDVFDDE